MAFASRLLDAAETRVRAGEASSLTVRLAASLVLALTWMPTMATVVFKGGVAEQETRLLRLLRRRYEPTLDAALRHPRRVVVIAVAVLAGSLTMVPFLGAEFIPRLDEGALAIQVVRLPSIALGESVRSTNRLESVLLEAFPNEVKTVVSKTGRPEIATDPMGVDVSDVFVILHPVEQWAATDKAALVTAMEARLRAEPPGQQFFFSQSIELRTHELLSGVRSDIAVSIYGNDLQTLKRSADGVARVLADIDGAADVKVEQVAGLPTLRIRIDRDRILATASTSTMSSQRSKRSAVGWWARSSRGSDASSAGEEAIARLPVQAPDGRLVPLGQLADVAVEEGPAQVAANRVPVESASKPTCAGETWRASWLRAKRVCRRRRWCRRVILCDGVDSLRTWRLPPCGWRWRCRWLWF